MKWLKKNNHWDASVSSGIISLYGGVGSGATPGTYLVTVSDSEGNSEDDCVESVEHGKKRVKEMIAKWISDLTEQLNEGEE